MNVRWLHNCPGRCGRPVPQDRFACRECWRRLPPELAEPIVANDQADWYAHMQAMADAEVWFAWQHTKAHREAR